MTVFTDTVTENLLIPWYTDQERDPVDTSSEQLETLTQGMGITPIPAFLYGTAATLTQAMTVAQTDAQFYTAIRSLIEGMILAQTEAPGMVYKPIQTELIELFELLNTGFPVTLTQAMTAAMALTATQAITVAESVGISQTMLQKLTYSLTVAQAVALADSLTNFVGASLAETMTIAMALTGIASFPGTLTQAMTIAQTQVSTLLARVVMEEGVEITQTDALKAIFAPYVTEGLYINGVYIAPDGSHTTWAINTATGAVTEYLNYVFNSFGKLGNRYIGAASDGLYELAGATDQGSTIVARIKGGMMNLGQSKYTSFKAAYIGMRDDGSHNDVYLRLVTGDNKTYTYKVQSKTMETVKVHFGKGLRARYFSYELYTAGQDFDLDNIEFVPIVAQRRT